MKIEIDEIDDFLFEKAYSILELNQNFMDFNDFQFEMRRKCNSALGCTKAVIQKWIHDMLDVGYLTPIKDGYIRGEWIGLDGNA